MRIDPDRFRELIADAIRLYEDLSSLVGSLENLREEGEGVFSTIEEYYQWEEQSRVREMQIQSLEQRRSLLEGEYRAKAEQLRDEGMPLGAWVGYGYYIVRLTDEGLELQPRPTS